MEEKMADNKIIQAKKQISVYEGNLREARSTLKGIEDLEDNFSHLNRNIERCLELLSSSVRNRKVTKMFEHMMYENKVSYRKTSYSLDEEKEFTRKKINKLSVDIDDLNKKIKEEYKKDKYNEEAKESKE